MNADPTTAPPAGSGPAPPPLAQGAGPPVPGPRPEASRDPRRSMRSCSRPEAGIRAATGRSCSRSSLTGTPWSWRPPTTAQRRNPAGTSTWRRTPRHTGAQDSGRRALRQLVPRRSAARWSDPTAHAGRRGAASPGSALACHRHDVAVVSESGEPDKWK